MSHTSLPHNVIHNECMTGYELNTQYNFILKQVYPPPHTHTKNPQKSSHQNFLQVCTSIMIFVLNNISKVPKFAEK